MHLSESSTEVNIFYIGVTCILALTHLKMVLSAKNSHSFV